MSLTKMDEYANVSKNEEGLYSKKSPISLNTMTTASTFDVSGFRSVELQPNLMTNTTAEIMFAIGATTVSATTAEGIVVNNGTRKLFLGGSEGTIAFKLTSATDGSAVTGGAADYLRIIGGK